MVKDEDEGEEPNKLHNTCDAATQTQPELLDIKPDLNRVESEGEKCAIYVMRHAIAQRDRLYDALTPLFALLDFEQNPSTSQGLYMAVLKSSQLLSRS